MLNTSLTKENAAILSCPQYVNSVLCHNFCTSSTINLSSYSNHDKLTRHPCIIHALKHRGSTKMYSKYLKNKSHSSSIKMIAVWFLIIAKNKISCFKRRWFLLIPMLVDLSHVEFYWCGMFCIWFAYICFVSVVQCCRVYKSRVGGVGLHRKAHLTLGTLDHATAQIEGDQRLWATTQDQKGLPNIMDETYGDVYYIDIFWTQIIWSFRYM